MNPLGGWIWESREYLLYILKDEKEFTRQRRKQRIFLVEGKFTQRLCNLARHRVLE